ncbi:MAG: hypothetical protein J3Q66DRAFT_10985 [Benniella sp.]|nr:MAG: hypothetical protein J3Q66DRAFT_10985 [Benniella sp.]
MRSSHPPQPPPPLGVEAEFGGKRYAAAVAIRDEERKERKKKKNKKTKDKDEDENEAEKADDDNEKGRKKPAPVKKVPTEAKDWFQSNHGIISLEAGTLKANLTRSISPLSPDQATADRLTIAIIAKVNNIISFMSQCRRWIHWAIELFISKTSTPEHRAELGRLMKPSENNNIVYWIGRCLSKSATQVDAVPDRYRLSKKIVLEAYEALGGGTAATRRTAALLGPPPTSSTIIYNDLVAFVITEYTRFFETGYERLREQMNVDRAFMRGNTMLSFLALNNGPGPDGHGRNYPQVSFQDPYVRITEDALLEILYSTDDPQLRKDMLAIFGAKKDCKDLVYTLFIESTRHAKTTMSMREASSMPFFKTTAPDYLDKVLQYNLGPKCISRRVPPQRPSHTNKKFRVSSGSITTNGLVVRFDAFDTRIPTHPPYERETTPLRRIRRLENFEANENANWLQLTNWASAGNLTIVGVDLGEVVTCAATAIPVLSHSQPGNVTNAIITRRSMYESTERFLTAIREKKDEPVRIQGTPDATVNNTVFPSIQEHEAAMPPRGAGDYASIRNFGIWMLACEPAMVSFYGSIWFKRKQWDSERGHRAEYEQAAAGVLRTAGIQTNAPVGNTPVVVAFGNGDFNTHTGRPTLHTAFTRFFIKKTST